MKTGEYTINLFRLDEGEHEWTWQLGAEFFSTREESPIQKGEAEAKVFLNKHSRIIEVAIEIRGEVELTCDRSLDAFMAPIKVDKEVLFKLAEVEEELENDVFHITEATEEVDLSSHLYDFIVLSLPMRRLHPRYFDEDGEEIAWEYENNEEPETEENSDPRWEALKNLGTKDDN